MESRTYGDTVKYPVVTGNDGKGNVTYSYAVKGNTDYKPNIPTAAGEYTVKASISATDNYNAAEVTADFNISKKAVTAASKNQVITYGDSITQNDTDYDITGLVSGDTAEIGLSVDEKTNKISISVTIKHGETDVTDNYTLTKTTGILTVNPKELAVTADAKEKLWEKKIRLLHIL